MKTNERNYFLENAISLYVKNNPYVDSVDICTQFKIRADIVFESIQELIKDKVIKREDIGYIYIKKEQ